MRRRILVTGAAGNVGWPLAQSLTENYDVIGLDREIKDESQAEIVRVVDLADLPALVAVMQGVDTVLHLAGAASPESPWDAVLPSNIIGLRNVLEAAREAGVRRMVFASSNHTMGVYDRHEQWPVYGSQLPRGDSLYGVSKIFGETLGRFYHDEFGLDFLALRIGWVADDPLSRDIDVMRAMWLSRRDCVQAFQRAIEAKARFGLYYVISDNPNRRWDVTNTMLELGYRPQDSWTDLSPQPEAVVEGGHPVPQDWPANS